MRKFLLVFIYLNTFNFFDLSQRIRSSKACIDLNGLYVLFAVPVTSCLVRQEFDAILEHIASATLDGPYMWLSDKTWRLAEPHISMRVSGGKKTSDRHSSFVPSSP